MTVDYRQSSTAVKSASRLAMGGVVGPRHFIRASGFRRIALFSAPGAATGSGGMPGLHPARQSGVGRRVAGAAASGPGRQLGRSPLVVIVAEVDVISRFTLARGDGGSLGRPNGG
jgi:hypothetical protein